MKVKRLPEAPRGLGLRALPSQARADVALPARPGLPFCGGFLLPPPALVGRVRVRLARKPAPR